MRVETAQDDAAEPPSAGDDIRNSYAVFDSKRDELMAHMTPRHRVQQGEPDTFAWSRDVLTMERYKPIIGAVKGYCLGQGLIYLLMLTDIRMPLMDGIALSLAAKRDYPELTILLMTGFADQRERARGLDAIVADVLTKPFTLADMRATVSRILRSARAVAAPAR